ncbi:MAG: TolC family protein [Spirochaetia bacterium]|nr:TolC family protein [Spirochaetia bacterium]
MRKLIFIISSILISCQNLSIKQADNILEPDFEKYSLVNNSRLEKALKKKNLNLDDIYALAVERTEKLAIEYANLKESEAEKIKAYSLFLPKISLRYQQNLINSNGSGSWIYFYAKQPLFSGLKEIYWFDKINSNIKVKENLLKYKAQRLYLEVAKAYYEALISKENLKSKKTSLDLLESRLTELRRRKKLGRSRQSEVLSASSQIAMLKADIQEENLKNQVNRENLIFLAGLPRDFSLDINISKDAENLAKETLKNNEKVNIENRFDISASKELLQYAETDLKSAYASYLPEISLQGNYNLKGSSSGSSSEKYSLQLNAEMPILYGTETLSNINTAKIRLNKAEFSHSETVRLAQSEIQKAKINLKAALSKEKAYEDAYNAAQKNYEVQNKEYSLGLVTNLDVLSALNDLEAAKIKYHKSKTDILINTIWLKIASGSQIQFE